MRRLHRQRKNSFERQVRIYPGYNGNGINVGFTGCENAIKNRLYQGMHMDIRTSAPEGDKDNVSELKSTKAP